jgi:DUF2892 family protein
MSIDRLVLVFAATMVLTGTVLAAAVSPWFLIIPAFVGLNLLQAQFTRFCPLAKLLAAAGCEPGSLFR